MHARIHQRLLGPSSLGTYLLQLGRAGRGCLLALPARLLHPRLRGIHLGRHGQAEPTLK
jgi:hypothetical protein